MANKIECVPYGDGVEITKLVTTDRDVIIPETHDGRTVVSLGDRFMMGSPGADSRTVTIPATVIHASSEAFSGTLGIRRIVYLGDFEVFNSFRVSAEYDCELVSTYQGREMRFGFLSGYPMCFPDFDEEIQKVSFKLSDEVSMKRLRDPIMLTDAARARYTEHLKSKILPVAEHAVTSNDPEALMSAVETGLLSDADLRTLLERSVRSGKTSMTSILMSVMYGRLENRK